MSYFRRKLMSGLLYEPKISIGGSSPISISGSVAGDVVSYDASGFRYMIQKAGSVTGTPIGVVVVPGSHNIYGDGSTAIMSLHNMSCATPFTGSTSEEEIYWGVYGEEVAGLSLYNHIVLNVSSGTPISTASGYSTYSNLPSDDSSWAGSVCPTDSLTRYKTASDTTVSPSPYNGTARSSVYYQTSSPSSSKNCLADYNGRLNTDLLLAQRGKRDYTSWAPGATTDTDFSAASCCDMYSTPGTRRGQWYLPSAGEMGYVVVREGVINTALTTLGCPTLKTTNYYWTSTGYDVSFSRLMLLSNGAVTYGDKNKGYYVRAFAKIVP